jgi:hypothetical protein
MTRIVRNFFRVGHVTVAVDDAIPPCNGVDETLTASQ